ncbi:uncharacterized protein LOC128553968 [Mercenaria mercenaria]|uniref:uncharacterized protein LOC128553968 n=1 Tax=Mercenaria mercenaria TaxID=6596 RepID=UPI00234E905F|nr:uncharacterized protein LOC128553968 [Mercenaria mercenaria]
MKMQMKTHFLYEAAVILRRRIQQSHGLDNMYFSKDEININEQVKFLDPLLFQFVNWVASDSKLEDSHNDPDQRIVSVCSDITYLVKHVITPKHLGLSIYLHHSFGSKKLIEDLHSHGYTLSYNEYRQFLTSAALHASSMQKKTFSGAIIPAHMSREERPDDDLIVVAADNWDHNEATLSGKQSTHAMTSILVTGRNRCASERIPRVSERSINLSSLPGVGLSNTLVYKKPTSRPIPPLSPVEISELKPSEPAETQKMRTNELMYNINRLVTTECPPWTVFQTHAFPDSVQEPSEIVYNPIIMAPPNDPNTIYTTLKRTKEQVNALGQSVCPVIFDMGLLTKALEIVWSRPEEFEGVVPIEGGMHFLMSLFGGIGFIYGDAGLKHLLVESDVFARNTADHILSGKDFDRALRALLMVDEVLNRRLLINFFRWAEDYGHTIPLSLFEKFKLLNIRSNGSDTVLAEIGNQIEVTISPLLKMFRAEGRLNSPLFQFWDDYLTHVSLPLKLYLAASRHALWDTYMYSKTILLPFLFCSNRTVYARYMPYMVMNMNRLPDTLLDSFQKGKFVAKLTDGMFNCVWIDYVLEVTQNKSLKSSGGIVGITHNDSALMRWFLSRPLTAKYAMEFQSGQKPSHHDPGKHHTDTPYHRKAYNESVDQMLKLFEEDTFIDPFCLTSPPSTLTNMATGVPAPPEIAASLLGCHITGETMLHNFVRDRFQVKGEQPPKKKFFDPMPRTKVKTMGATKASVKLKTRPLTSMAKRCMMEQFEDANSRKTW